MLNVETEVKKALSEKNKLSAYLLDLKAERNRLVFGNILADSIAATRRLARVDAELAAGQEIFRQVSVLCQDLQYRQKNPKGGKNYSAWLRGKDIKE